MAGLIERIAADAKVPVIKHLDGNCPFMWTSMPTSESRCVSLTTRNASATVCGAMESLLVHEARIHDVLPRIAKIFADKTSKCVAVNVPAARLPR